MSTINYQEVLDTFRRKAAVEIFPALGLPDDYSPESLERLEYVVDSHFPQEGEPAMASTYFPFGFYLGETIVRNIEGATWDTSEATQYFNQIAIDIPGRDGMKTRIYPFVRAMKYFTDRTDGFSVFYRTLKLMALGGFDPTAVKEGQWVEYPNGDRIRSVSPENYGK